MLTQSAIIRAEKVFKTIYNKAIGEMAVSSPFIALGRLATEIPSDGGEEDYRWLGTMPLFTEWLGDITVEDLADYEYTIKNKHFAGAVGVDRDELEDDKFGLIIPRIQSLAYRALVHRGRRIHTLIANGTTNLAFDGIAFFSNVSAPRVNDNLLAGTLTATGGTLAQVQADIDAMRQAMMAFVDDKGEIIGLAPDTFVVHPLYERLFRMVAESSTDPTLTLPSGVKNVFQGWIKEVVVDPALAVADANDFYGFCTEYPIKGLVFQNRQERETWLDDTNKNVNKKLVFGADYRAGYGYALPQLACKSVGA